MDTIKFYSIYENGKLIKSYSPYINATDNHFIISDPNITLNIEPYSKQVPIEYPIEPPKDKYYYFNDGDNTNEYETDELRPKFVINILNTPLKSGIIVSKGVRCPETNFKIIYKISAIKGIDVDVDPNKGHRVEIKTQTILDDYLKNAENTKKKFTEIQESNKNILRDIQNYNNIVDSQIKGIEGEIDTYININKEILVNINKEGQYFRNVINMDIKNKLKKIATVQFNLQITDKKMRELKIKYQEKVKYSFAVTQDEEYLSRLNQTISKMEFSIKMLENQLKDRKNEIYKNYLETNKIINQINNFIYVINKTLKNKKEIKEYFQDTNISNFNEQLFNNNNIIVTNLENITEENNKYDTQLNKRNNLIIERDKLKIINNFYNKLLKSLNPAYNQNTDSLDRNNMKTIFANLIIKLDDIESNLINNLNASRNALVKLEEKYASAEFVPIELENNPEIVYQLELKLLDLEDIKERLNRRIKNINQSPRANKMLDTLKKINIDINKPQLRDFNPMEAFQNPAFRSAESHNNYFLSLKPMNNNQYKIRVNDKCLKVNGSNNYRLDDCNLSSTSQLFKTHRINTEVDALNLNKDQIFEGNNNIKYPYYQIKSTISNDCVNMDKDGISLSTCSSNSLKQRWNLSSDEKICLDN